MCAEWKESFCSSEGKRRKIVRYTPTPFTSIRAYERTRNFHFVRTLLCKGRAGEGYERRGGREGSSNKSLVFIASPFSFFENERSFTSFDPLNASRLRQPYAHFSLGSFDKRFLRLPLFLGVFPSFHSSTVLLSSRCTVCIVHSAAADLADLTDRGPPHAIPALIAAHHRASPPKP